MADPVVLVDAMSSTLWDSTRSILDDGVAGNERVIPGSKYVLLCYFLKSGFLYIGVSLAPQTCGMRFL